MSVQHIIEVGQFCDPALRESLLGRAAEFAAMPLQDYPSPLASNTVATLFYEPSTRTRLSFETAAQNLGAHIVSTENAGDYSSASKGETLEDTIRTLEGYAQTIVLRHKDDDSAQRASKVAAVPIVNAGAGKGEHPTQALLDLYTINEAKGGPEGLRVGFVGDLKHGRTVHSLVTLLREFSGVEVVGIAPECLAMPEAYKRPGDKYYDDLATAIPTLDVIYMTRVQDERITDETVRTEYQASADRFVLDAGLMRRAKEDAIVMHPLPRVGEITPDVDDDPRAIYFKQAHNGLFVRMALLEWVMGGAA